MIFRFIVRHCRWLARLPVLPHIFDALLLAWTAIFHRDRLAALTAIEAQALLWPGVRSQRHRFGGIGFVYGEKEFAHVHGNGLLDVCVRRSLADSLVAAGIAEPHHVFGPSSWVSFWIASRADLTDAVKLLRAGLGSAMGPSMAEPYPFMPGPQTPSPAAQPQGQPEG